MGALCSALPGAPQPPEIDAEKVGELIKTATESIPQAVQENEEKITKELKKLKDDETFSVENTAMKLKKNASKEEIRKAATFSALGDELRGQIKDQVWGEMEGPIEEGLPDDVKSNDFLKKGTMSLAQKAVEKIVDTALDKMLEKLADESGEDDGNDNDAEEADEAVDEAVAAAKKKN